MNVIDIVSFEIFERVVSNINIKNDSLNMKILYNNMFAKLGAILRPLKK